MNKQAVLYIVIPCYNEEEVLPITCKLFLSELEKLIDRGQIASESRILFVNDGSSDKTWKIICDLARSNKHFIGISQSRNRGHQNAVLAGLMEAKDHCDITISIDCDGQDDINAMDKMVEEYQNSLHETMVKINQAMAAVAAEKKATTIFRSQAVTALTKYTIDVTNDILQKINEIK